MAYKCYDDFFSYNLPATEGSSGYMRYDDLHVPLCVFLLLFRVGSLRLLAMLTNFTLFLGSRGSMSWR